MSERMRKFFKNIFGRNNQDNIHINDVTPDQPKEKSGRFKRLRKRISRLFGCRRPCCSDIAEEPELPYEEAKEEMKPYSPISFKKCCEKIKMRVDLDSYFAPSAEYSMEYPEAFECEMKPYSPVSFKKCCEKIKMRVDWDSYFASSAEYSTEYPEAFEREEEQRELFKPLTPDYCLTQTEDEDDEREPLGCSSDIPPIGSQDSDEVGPYDSLIKWFKIEVEDALNRIFDADPPTMQMEIEDIELEPLGCSSDIPPIGSQDSDEVGPYDSLIKWFKIEVEDALNRIFAPAVRTHCWMEDEDSTSQDSGSSFASTADSSLVQEVPVPFILDDSDRESIDQEEVPVPFILDDSDRESIDQEEVPVPFILDDSDKESIDQEEVLRPIPPDPSTMQLEIEDLDLENQY
ncbi:uncharacterized protein LOC116412445 isoform X1 [Xenopus tropicalis]|uniref:Uncharacterized protein LOC116412445 isoform X1 n=1 Tax=Xenopus tropicalis TaxID=8364 RepID=A0A8J1K1G8_XENTR|nr:uncharacterized protein LOC116412445 isoform X1 [Xenopus tropicalis]